MLIRDLVIPFHNFILISPFKGSGVSGKHVPAHHQNQTAVSRVGFNTNIVSKFLFNLYYKLVHNSSTIFSHKRKKICRLCAERKKMKKKKNKNDVRNLNETFL